MSNSIHKFRKINLSKAEGHHCSRIKTGSTYYLVKISGDWFIGHFSDILFGLSFFPWYGTSIQFDAPGSNESDWEEVWEMQKEPRP